MSRLNEYRSEAGRLRALIWKQVREFESDHSWEQELWDQQQDELNDAAERAEQLFDNDPKESLRLYRETSQQGHTPSTYAIGLFYARGHGIERDDAEAALWFERAFDEGSWLAGILYTKMLKNLNRREEARQWLEKAVKAGHLPSKYYLARALWYERDIGATKQRIRELLEDLIAKRHLGAQLMLGRMMARREYGVHNVLRGLRLIFDLPKRVDSAMHAPD